MNARCFHLGGNIYCSVLENNPCIDIRQYWKPENVAVPNVPGTDKERFVFDTFRIRTFEKEHCRHWTKTSRIERCDCVSIKIWRTYLPAPNVVRIQRIMLKYIGIKEWTCIYLYFIFSEIVLLQWWCSYINDVMFRIKRTWPYPIPLHFYTVTRPIDNLFLLRWWRTALYTSWSE